MTAFASAEISDDEPWRAPSASRLNRENGASLSADSFDEERQLARAEPSARGRQTPAQARPVKAVSRQSRARASASLDRRRLVRQRHSKRRSLSNAKPGRSRPHIALTS